MNSRERIKCALQHRSPDVLPIDFGGMRSTGIQAIAYNKLLAHLGLVNEETRMYDIFQQLAEPDFELEQVITPGYQQRRVRLS